MKKQDLFEHFSRDIVIEGRSGHFVPDRLEGPTGLIPVQLAPHLARKGLSSGTCVKTPGWQLQNHFRTLGLQGSQAGAAHVTFNAPPHTLRVTPNTGTLQLGGSAGFLITDNWDAGCAAGYWSGHRVPAQPAYHPHTLPSGPPGRPTGGTRLQPDSKEG